MPNTLTPTTMKTSDIVTMLHQDKPLIDALYSENEQADWSPGLGHAPTGGPDRSLMATTRTSLLAELDRRIPIPA